MHRRFPCTIPEKQLHANFDLGLSACTTRVRKTKVRTTPEANCANANSANANSANANSAKRSTGRMRQECECQMCKCQQCDATSVRKKCDSSANDNNAKRTLCRDMHCFTDLKVEKPEFWDCQAAFSAQRKKRTRQRLHVLEIPTFSAEAKVPYDKKTIGNRKRDWAWGGSGW